MATVKDYIKHTLEFDDNELASYPYLGSVNISSSIGSDCEALIDGTHRSMVNLPDAIALDYTVKIRSTMAHTCAKHCSSMCATAPRVKDNVANYIYNQLDYDTDLDNEPQHDLTDMPMDSVVGRDCKKCIDSLLAFLDTITDARSCAFDTTTTPKLIQACVEQCRVYAYG